MFRQVNSRRKKIITLSISLVILLAAYACVSQRYRGVAAEELAGIPMVQSTPQPTASPTAEAETINALNTIEWNQLGHDPQRTGYVPTEIPGPWQVKWIWNGPIGGGDAGPAGNHLRLPQGVQPITGGGQLYVGHSDGRVRAISEETGQEVWVSQSLGAAIVNTGAYDAQTNSVYFGAQNGKFYQLNATTGVQKRVVDLRGAADMAPLLAGDTIYIGSRTGTLYALNKATLVQRWSYDAGAELIGSAAYAANHGGLIIILAEDKSIHAIQVSDGRRRWRVTVNGDGDPLRGNTVFADTYPVVSEVNDVVIVRSYLDWDKMWNPNGGAPSSIVEIQNFLSNNPEYQSFFVLNLADGTQRFVPPVLVGAIGNGGDFESVPPQAVVKRLEDGTEVAYLLWRNRQACLISSCDGREDTTVGEMNLSTGNIRFVQDYKNAGTMRMPTDEQSPLSMAGNTLLHAHWMTLGAVRITDRSANLGDSYVKPIFSRELTPTLNTLTSGSCPDRTNHYCPQEMFAPGDGYPNDPGFYVYYSSQRIYDQYWTTPVRSAIISSGTIYWKSVDGAITALQTSWSGLSISKSASTSTAEFGETVTYKITIQDYRGILTDSVYLTDTIPLELEYIPGTFTASAGKVDDSAAPVLTWSGNLLAPANVTITYDANVIEQDPALIRNTAIIDIGPSTELYIRTAFIIANGYTVYLPMIFKEKV
jgi:uncharacterized repeat protein (TIGR01451 family)